MTEFTQVKGVAAPARRALADAGYSHLEQLSDARESDLAALHGMGPNALKALREALAERGLSFRPG
jgi:predicted Fe-Mo cluster-binding NifX family protein